MTLNLFPVTGIGAPGRVSWSILKTSNWATRMQRSVIGRELTISDYVLPLYSFTMIWDLLRDKWDTRLALGLGRGSGYDELRQIWNFYNGQQGSAIPFRFFDQSDNTTRTPAAPSTPLIFVFATGDGVTTAFQMASPLLAPVIPNSIVTVNLNGTPTGAYTLDTDTGIITFTSAPGNGVAIGADYTFYYRVRFNTDGLEAENFAYQFWHMKQLKLVSKAY